MKIYVFGANGMMGSYLHKYLKTPIPIVRNQIEATKIPLKDLYSQLSLLGAEKNDVIINAIGITNKRKNEPIEFMIVNAIFPKVLADYCENYGINLIHISTDCVFSGSKGYYKENDLPDDSAIYGISKSLGEPSNCAVIRTSIIGENRANNLDLLEWVRSHKDTVITGWVNHIWNGVTCLELAKVCEWIINNNFYWKGVKHIYSPTTVNKAELVEMINDVYGLNNQIEKTSAPVDCDRTLSSINPIPFAIPNLRTQIIEQKNFEL
jgi:dTDP-4-dehydrorhamnose reductase